MSDYRRAYIPGGCYFFTVVTYARRPLFRHEAAIVRLREALRRVRAKHPFEIDAIVVLPDHLHAIWRLPEGDSDFSLRWRLVKHYVASGTSGMPSHRNEKGVWQRRFWEHVLRDGTDWRNHLDYIHYNPVRHGYVRCPAEWPHGSFNSAVAKGLYPPDWGRSPPPGIAGINRE